MPFELERLEDRLAPATVPAAPADAPLPPAAAEALLDPLRNRLGPRQDNAPHFPAASSHASPSPVSLAALDELEDDDLIDDDAPADRPTAEISDLALQADPDDQASAHAGAA